MKSKLTNFLSLAVVMLVLTAVFTVSAFAEISGGFGNILGLDANKTYEAAPATLNTAGNGLAIGGYDAVSGTTTGLAGLYYVRETGVTENGTLIYVRPKFADLSSIYERDSNLQIINETNDALREGFSVGKLTSRNFPPLNATYDNAATQVATISIFKSGSTASETEKKAAFDSNVDFFKRLSVRYAFLNKEIVPISEVKSYAWGIAAFYSNFKYTGLVSKFVARVVLPNGEVKAYEYLHAPEDYGIYGKCENTKWNVDATKVVDFTQKTSAKGSWTEELPSEGYLVGFEFYPLYGMTDYSKVETGVGVLKSNIYNATTIHISDVDYVIEQPGYDAPTGLTVNGRTVSGLEVSKSYVAVPFTAIGQDTANQIPIPAGSTSYTFPDSTVGLWAIAVKGDEYYANSDVGEVFYFEGKYPVRQSLGVVESGNTLANYVSGTNYAKPGQIVIPSPHDGGCSASDKAYTYYAQSQGTGNRDAKVAEVCNTQTAYNAIKDSTTATPQEKQDALNALNAAKTALVDAIKDKPCFIYAYTSDEIIPAKELKQLKFGLTAPQGPISVPHPSIVFSVMDTTGKITEYTWKWELTDSNKSEKGWVTKVAVLTDVLPQTDGHYVVGFKIYAEGNLTADKLEFYSDVTPTGYRNSAIHVKTSFYFNDYEIIVKKAPTPTGITVNEETVSGFGSDYDYVAVPITINGADNSKAVDITPVDGKYTFDANTMPGLWGVAIKGDGEWYMNSDTSAPFYIKGSVDARQKIGTFDSNPDYPVFAKGNGYVIGTFIGAGIDYPVWENRAVSGAYGNLAQYVPGVGSAIDIWGRMHTYEEALAIYNESKTDTKPCNGLLTEIEKFYTDEFKAKDPATVAAELVAIKESVKETVQSLVYYYGYDSDEIIAVDELLNFKVGFGKPQGAVLYTDVMAKLSFAVMNSAGEVNEYSTLVGPFNLVNNGFSKSFDVDVQAIEGLPSEGWIVGFKLQPYAELSLDNITAKAWAPQDERGSAYIFPQTQTSWYFYHGTKDYAIKQDAPTPELSSFPVIGGGFGQISGLNPSYLYEYKYSADGTTYPDSWSDVPANATALNVTEAGYYMVRAKNTADYGKSEVALIRVIEYTGAIDELPYTEPVTKMYLPSDFVELQAEYEIDVTIKNWVASLALENIKALSPESVIKINGEEFKFSVTAADIETDEAVHYYNMDVSLFGESRHNVDLEKFKELAGDAYLTDIYFESSKPLPFKKAELSVYLGAEYDGYDVELNLYNEKINRLRLVETASVYEGWATFTNCAETYVVVLPD